MKFNEWSQLFNGKRIVRLLCFLTFQFFHGMLSVAIGRWSLTFSEIKTRSSDFGMDFYIAVPRLFAGDVGMWLFVFLLGRVSRLVLENLEEGCPMLYI